MSHLILNPSNALVIRPGGGNSELPTKPFPSQRQKRRNRITFLTCEAVTVLALALIILGVALSRPCLATPGTWSLTGAMTVGRELHTATLLPNGQVMVVGGRQFLPNSWDHKYLSYLELYDPATGSWHHPPNVMILERCEHTATLLTDGRVLLAGGQIYDSAMRYAEIYDPDSLSSPATPSMGSIRAGHTATLLPNGQVLVAGGKADLSFNDPSVISNAEIYDPVTGTWSPTGSMHQERCNHTATLLPNGQVLVAGGWHYDNYGYTEFLFSAELYNPVTGTWSLTNNSSARGVHTAILLHNGKVLFPEWARIYDPDSGQWSDTNYLKTDRENNTAALLHNGNVLVAGGMFPGYPNVLSSAELYFQVLTARIWNYTGSLCQSRWNHTATLLPNGKVLVAGGRYDSSNTSPLCSAELYEPEPSPAVQLPPLLGFYPFEGNAQDWSGNRRHGTVSGSPIVGTPAGYEGQGYYFYGVADYITVPLNINPDQYPRLTMGAWCKKLSAGWLQPLLTHDDGGYDRSITIDYRGGGIGWSAFCGPWGQVLGAVPAIYQKWSFVAVVYDQVAQTARLQVDDMVLTKTGVGLGLGQSQLHIGASPKFGNFFKGCIDNVFVFGEALTDKQLAYIRSGGAQAIMTATKKRPNPGLLLLLMD